ncbi:hypothetical protein [Rhodococcoides corynebacterioides]|uniref:hypothetical protein n=1 Tax=Rhodococcoides corynebacterioides TaxID=53972 RepID=UPI00082EDCE9|nr:hypothetical protein [Rhodococcus corynebacterioides]
MAVDALDPGPRGDYPYLPRNPDGSLDSNLMPVGERLRRGRDGQLLIIDVTPTVADGRKVTEIPPPAP